MALSFRIAEWANWPIDDVVLPMSLRRRATAIGQKALKTALAVLPEGSAPRYVLSSRHGEIGRTTNLLAALATEGAVSPADFSMAVHHGLAGLLSIHTGNKQGHTAIAAGADSFAYGLIEAATTVAESKEPVLLIHFDEVLPEIYAPVAEDLGKEIVLALLLHPEDGAPFALEPATEPQGTGDMAAGFLSFLRSNASSGGSGRWRWSRDA